MNRIKLLAACLPLVLAGCYDNSPKPIQADAAFPECVETARAVCHPSTSAACRSETFKICLNHHQKEHHQ